MAQLDRFVLNKCRVRQLFHRDFTESSHCFHLSLIRYLMIKNVNWLRLRFTLSLASALGMIALTVAFCFYPAFTLIRVILDSELKETGHSQLLPSWFEATSARQSAWAQVYLESDMAESVVHTEVAATEWPMFGSVFYLVAAQELHDQGKIDATSGVIRDAVERSAEIVASSKTATWVRTKWGAEYLEQENVFYRMLLIMGLASYESLTGDLTHHALMSEQRVSLAAELVAAKYHLRDDYPNECWPNDVLWAVAAIQRAAALDETNHHALSASLMTTFNASPVLVRGLPAYQMFSRSGRVVQSPRGCGNSGILTFAAELDPEIAQDWYRSYANDFWKDNGWLAGFTELPVGSENQVMDVDSGPIFLEFGSVASAFGIGASNSVGRLDHSVPLTLEAVACSWPTPFGFIVPKVMGRMAVDSSSLGEVALLFSMSRPSLVEELVPYDGNIPGIVWVLLCIYLGVGALFIGLEVRGIRRALSKYRQRSLSIL